MIKQAFKAKISIKNPKQNKAFKTRMQAQAVLLLPSFNWDSPCSIPIQKKE